MRQVQFIRSNTFRWALTVAAASAVLVVALFGFIYWKIDGYLISRSDQMITQQISFIAGLPPDRRINAMSISRKIRKECTMRHCSTRPELGSLATSSVYRQRSGSTDRCSACG
jgi:hypothetical protein